MPLNLGFLRLKKRTSTKDFLSSFKTIVSWILSFIALYILKRCIIVMSLKLSSSRKTDGQSLNNDYKNVAIK